MNSAPEAEISVVYCTVPPADASRIAYELLERRLIACVNISPVRSLYRWEGHVCDDQEELLIMKTASRLVPDLVAAVTAIHPYTTPEVIALPVTQGFPGYLDWVMAETS